MFIQYIYKSHYIKFKISHYNLFNLMIDDTKTIDE